MSILQKVYDRSPIFMQNLMVGVAGATKARQRYGRVYHAHRAWLRSYDAWSLEHMMEDQSNQLRELIQFASTNSDFYRRSFAGINLEQIRDARDLSLLPVLEKEQLRNHALDIFTVSARDSIEAHTGGDNWKVASGPLHARGCDEAHGYARSL